LKRLRLLGALALVAAAACSPKNNGTLLVAHVDTDLAVGASGAIDSVQIQVVPQHGGGSTDTFPLTSRASLPTLAIVPSGDPAFSIDVTATGRKGSTTVVSQTATVAFAPGEAREFTLFLAQDCVNAAPCSPATNVCIKGGSCVAKTQVAQTKPYVPSGTDAGGTDAGMDAPRDTGFDAGGRDARDNPGQWVAANPAFPTPTATLYGVWPLDDGTVWVAGASGSRGIAAHFVQGLWVEAVLPNNAPTLFGIWASGPTDIWAVGINGTVLHFDGGPTGLWTTVPISGTQPTATLTGVWGASSADVWIVGQGGLILHGSAGGVAAEPSGTTADLAGIWGLSATDVWAVAARAPVLRRNATGWAVQTATLGPNIYYGIWLAATNDAWIAGDRATLHNDGAAWTGVTNPLDSATSIWGSASDDVWSVGHPVTGGTTFISRFNGVQWVAAASPSTMSLQAVRGTSATNVWAVGSGGTVLRLQVP
jgi:hypothetical protein